MCVVHQFIAVVACARRCPRSGRPACTGRPENGAAICTQLPVEMPTKYVLAGWAEASILNAATLRRAHV